MGYSDNIAVVHKMESVLELLISLNRSTQITHAEPHKFVYAIREAFHAAKRHGFQEYADLKNKFKFRIDGNVIKIEINEQLSAQVEQFVLIIAEAVEPLEVLGALIENRVPQLNFPNASDAAIVAATKWAEKNNYQSTLTVESGLHLKKNV